MARPVSCTTYTPEYWPASWIRMREPSGSTSGSAATTPSRLRVPAAVRPSTEYAVAVNGIRPRSAWATTARRVATTTATTHGGRAHIIPFHTPRVPAAIPIVGRGRLTHSRDAGGGPRGSALLHTAVVQLDAAQREFWERNGYLVLERFFSASDVADVARWTEEITAWPDAPGRWMRYYEAAPSGGKLPARLENFLPYHAALDG